MGILRTRNSGTQHSTEYKPIGITKERLNIECAKGSKYGISAFPSKAAFYHCCEQSLWEAVFRDVAEEFGWCTHSSWHGATLQFQNRILSTVLTNRASAISENLCVAEGHASYLKSWFIPVHSYLLGCYNEAACKSGIIAGRHSNLRNGARASIELYLSFHSFK